MHRDRLADALERALGTGVAVLGVAVAGGALVSGLLVAASGDPGLAVLVALAVHLLGTGAPALLPARLSGRIGLVPAAVLGRVLQGGAVVAMGLLAGPAGALTGYLLVNLVHGAANPLHSALLHARVDGGHRATLLSISSLVFQLGTNIRGSLREFAEILTQSRPEVFSDRLGLLRIHPDQQCAQPGPRTQVHARGQPPQHDHIADPGGWNRCCTGGEGWV